MTTKDAMQRKFRTLYRGYDLSEALEALEEGWQK